jgi:hypothetical protein
MANTLSLHAALPIWPSGGNWTSAGTNITYITNHWELMLVPAASCPLGKADIRARLRDGEGWSGWTAASGFIMVTNSPPVVSSLTVSSASVRRAQNITLTVTGADAEDPRKNVSCEVEVKPTNQTDWIKLPNVGLAADRWTVAFKPQPRASLGKYDARARLRDADLACGDWNYLWESFAVQNAIPVASFLGLSTASAERGSLVTITVRGSAAGSTNIVMSSVHMDDDSGNTIGPNANAVGVLNVGTYAGPTASFTGTPTSGNAPLTVAFDSSASTGTRPKVPLAT